MVNGIFYDSNDLTSANDNAFLYNASYVTSYRLYNTFMLIRKLEFVTICNINEPNIIIQNFLNLRKKRLD